MTSIGRWNINNELLGTIRFIASLAAVDGVVLLDRILAVRGFGAELHANHRPDDVLLAGDASGSPDRLREVEPDPVQHTASP